MGHYRSESDTAPWYGLTQQEALVLETPHRLPDSELAHYLTRSPCGRETALGELLQLRDARRKPD